MVDRVTVGTNCSGSVHVEQNASERENVLIHRPKMIGLTIHS